MRGKEQRRDGAYDCRRQATAPVRRGSSGVYRAGMSPLSASSEKRRTWSLPKRLAIAGPIAAAAIVVADIVAWNQDLLGLPQLVDC